MARNTIRSSNAVVATTDSSNAWSTANQSLLLHRLTQNVSYSIQMPRSNMKQVGSQEFAFRNSFSQPDVQLEISYIPEPSFSNEVAGRFVGTSNNWLSFKNMFDEAEESSEDTNFYVFLVDNEDEDFLNEIEFYSTLNFDGYDAISFGNCFPNSYNLRYGVGQLPIVSTSYICSNSVFNNLTGTSEVSPAINLTGGNNDGVGRTEFLFAVRGTAELEKNPPIVNPVNTESNITLQNLQVGGQALSGFHYVQTVDMNVNLERTSNYGLGSDFAYGRKPQFPAQGSFAVTSEVSGLAAGQLTGVLDNDRNYDFQLVLEATGKKRIYQIEDAKLDTYSYQMNVNETMSFDASFSFEVTQTKGLKISGTIY